MGAYIKSFIKYNNQLQANEKTNTSTKEVNDERN